jgi:hypothetical protein
MRIFALLLALLAPASAAPAAQAAFEVTGFGGGALEADGEPATKAGGHFDSYVTKLTVSSETGDLGLPVPTEGGMKRVAVDLPLGFTGNPLAVTTCTIGLLLDEECGGESQVGMAFLKVNGLPNPAFGAIYSVAPAPGAAATFAFRAGGVMTVLNASIRPEDNGLRVVGNYLSQGLGVIGSEIIFWGMPSDPVHDPERWCQRTKGCGSTGPEVPLFTSPTNCAGPMTTRATVESWRGSVARAEYVSRFADESPVVLEDCESVPFEPQMKIVPTSSEADSPTGLEVDLSIPQAGLLNKFATASAHLKRVEVTLPEGMAVNPSSADGLGGCSPRQIELGGPDPAACPPNSKIGAVELTTPLLEKTLYGSVYVAAQGDNPFGSLIALYIAIEDPKTGIVVKLPGKVSPDPGSGRLTASFDQAPQLPFEDLHVELFAGPRASLINPPDCGSYSASAALTPWSAADPDSPTAAEVVTSATPFQISSGPGGSACPAGAFDPRLQAGVTNPIAGDHSPFVLSVSRADGTQRLTSITADLPPGLVGKLAGIAYCPDATLAAIPGGEGTGAAQLAAPSCPAASEIGRVTVGAGAGPSPVFVRTGRAYLAGPYKGSPLSVAFVTPALAGPFDLGNVVVRAALQVNPVTAEVSAVSDPLPTILHGIPLDIRYVEVGLDRHEFILNPTSCDPMSVAATIGSLSGQHASPSSRFQVAGCERLAFEPRLNLSLKGKTNRGAYQRLRAELKAKKGQANIGRAAVTMPPSIFLAQEHIRTICTRVQWSADACPKGSIYGKARAFTPLLDEPLEGNVYLRANGGARELPDLVADLRGQIRIELVGYIDSANGGIRTRFQNVPDAPVSKFVLEMKGGKKSLLTSNRNLCGSANRATVKMDGHNGKTHDFKPKLKVTCGKKR